MPDMPSQNTIDERHQDEVMVLNLRERYATTFLAMYALKMDGFLAIVAKDERSSVAERYDSRAQEVSV